MRRQGYPPWLTCREFTEFLNDYLTGALPPEKHAEFDSHLAQCPPCVVYLDTYRATIQMGKAALAQDDAAVPGSVPEDLVKAILAARRKPS